MLAQSWLMQISSRMLPAPLLACRYLVLWDWHAHKRRRIHIKASAPCGDHAGKCLRVLPHDLLAEPLQYCFAVGQVLSSY